IIAARTADRALGRSRSGVRRSRSGVRRSRSGVRRRGLARSWLGRLRRWRRLARRRLRRTGALGDLHVTDLNREGFRCGFPVDTLLEVGTDLIIVSKRAIVIDEPNAVAPDVKRAVAERVELDRHLHIVPPPTLDIPGIGIELHERVAGSVC